MLGANVFGWTVGEADSFRLLDQAFDNGLNFIDTADVYSRWVPGNTGGESEIILGKWFARTRKRNHVILATKVGMDMGESRIGLAPARIRQAVEESLRRLQTDHIDLYQSHKDDPDTPLADTLAEYSRLIEEGKVRFIGASNYTGARFKEAILTSRDAGLPEYQSLQPHYNLVERSGYESDLAPVVAEFGPAVIPYYALASGFLSGKYRTLEDAEGRARGRGVSKYLNEKGFATVAALDAAAREISSKPAVIALAWLAAQPGITAPIASATTSEQLADLVVAAAITLPLETLATLSAL